MTMTRLKVSSAAFRHVEAELYAYPETVKEIKIRRAELLSGSNEELVGGKSNLPGDPVGRAVARVTDDRRLRQMERVTSTIESVLESTDTDEELNPYRRIVELYYWQKNKKYSWERIAAEAKVSRATAFRMRRLIVHAIAERLGW